MADVLIPLIAIAVGAILLAGVVALSRAARRSNPTTLHDIRDPDERRNR